MNKMHNAGRGMKNKNKRQGPNIKFQIIFLAVFIFMSADSVSGDTVFNRVFFKDFTDIGEAVAGNPAGALMYTSAFAAVLIPVINNDKWLLEEFRSNSNDFNDAVFEYSNYGGDGIYVLAGASLLFLGGEKEKKTAERVIEAVVVAGAINYFLKLSTGRERPYSSDSPYSFKPYSFNTSMPSGHACTAFAWAVVIGDNYDIGYITYPAAVLTAMARVYRNKHWPSDVIAGALIGTVMAKIINARGLFGENVRPEISLKRETPRVGINICM